MNNLRNQSYCHLTLPFSDKHENLRLWANPKGFPRFSVTMERSTAFTAAAPLYDEHKHINNEVGLSTLTLHSNDT